MKKFDIFTFGNISIDIIETPLTRYDMTGGAILYASWVAHQLGHSMAILTKISFKDKERVNEFPNSKTQLYVLESSKTTSILNFYPTEDKERRKCTNKGMADPYKLEDFPDFEAKVIQYSGLLQGEIDRSIIQFLSNKGKLAIDAQGLLRKVFDDGTMEFAPFENIQNIIKNIYYFKADAAEAQFITGIDTESQGGRIAAGKKLLSWGAKEVIISHNKALTAFAGDEIVSFPFKNKTLEGRTGRGDTSFSAYILKRITESVEDSLKFATALTSMKMEIAGPFKKDVQEVYEFIEENY